MDLGIVVPEVLIGIVHPPFGFLLDQSVARPDNRIHQGHPFLLPQVSSRHGHKARDKVSGRNLRLRRRQTAFVHKATLPAAMAIQWRRTFSSEWEFKAST